VKSSIGRLYAISAMLVVFFVSWALVAAHPWATSAHRVDPRLAALAARERHLQAETVAVRKVLQKRWGNYRTALAHRLRAIAKARRKLSLLASQAQAQTATVYAAPALPAAAAAPAPPVVPSAPVTATKTS
jgi:hypothetical protein